MNFLHEFPWLAWVAPSIILGIALVAVWIGFPPALNFTAALALLCAAAALVWIGRRSPWRRWGCAGELALLYALYLIAANMWCILLSC